jgi:transposase
MKCLKAKQLKCLEMLICGDLLQKEIAEELGVSENTITNWKKSEEFQKAYTSTIHNKILYATGKALKTQTELLNSKNDNVRYSAAKDILDRAGFKDEDKVKIEGESSVIIFKGEENLE